MFYKGKTWRVWISCFTQGVTVRLLGPPPRPSLEMSLPLPLSPFPGKDQATHMPSIGAATSD